MLPFLKREFPKLEARYRELYVTRAHLGRPYKDALAARVRRVRERYGLASGMIEYRPGLWVAKDRESCFR